MLYIKVLLEQWRHTSAARKASRKSKDEHRKFESERLRKIYGFMRNEGYSDDTSSDCSIVYENTKDT